MLRTIALSLLISTALIQKSKSSWPSEEDPYFDQPNYYLIELNVGSYNKNEVSESQEDFFARLFNASVNQEYKPTFTMGDNELNSLSQQQLTSQTTDINVDANPNVTHPPSLPKEDNKQLPKEGNQNDEVFSLGPSKNSRLEEAQKDKEGQLTQVSVASEEEEEARHYKADVEAENSEADNNFKSKPFEGSSHKKISHSQSSNNKFEWKKFTLEKKVSLVTQSIKAGLIISEIAKKYERSDMEVRLFIEKYQGRFPELLSANLFAWDYMSVRKKARAIIQHKEEGLSYRQISELYNTTANNIGTFNSRYKKRFPQLASPKNKKKKLTTSSDSTASKKRKHTELSSNDNEPKRKRKRHRNIKITR